MKLLLFFSLFPFSLFSQVYNVRNSGTFIIAAINKEGLFLCADSRAVYFDPNHEVYAYVEGIQKIFKYKNLYFQNAGVGEFTLYTFKGIFSLFEKENNKPVNVKTFYSVFTNFVKMKLSAEDYADFQEHGQFLVSGYFNGSPHIYYYVKDRVDSAVGKGFKSNDYTFNTNPVNANWYNDKDFKTSLNVTKKLIKQVEVDGGKFSKIGGEVSFVYAKKNGEHSETIQNTCPYLTEKETIRANYYDKTHLVFRSQRDSILFKKSIKLTFQKLFNSEP